MDSDITRLVLGLVGIFCAVLLFTIAIALTVEIINTNRECEATEYVADKVAETVLAIFDGE